MADDLFTGALVQLAALDSDAAEHFARWGLDSEYIRLADSGPAYPSLASHIRKDLENAGAGKTSFSFAIHSLTDDCMIGDIGLWIGQWTYRDAFVGIAIGDRAYWGRGYGTDAMRILLRYAFQELNVHRVSLDVFEYNRRAIRSYEKSGFVVEGRLRKWLNREGRRWDMIFMGILREEWERIMVTGSG